MSAPIVTVRTLLGENTVPVLAALAAHLSATSGLDLRFENGDGARSSDDHDIWQHDLVWACGLISLRSIDATRRARDTRAADDADGIGADSDRVGARTIGDIIAAPVFAGETSACYHSLIVARPDGPVRTMADVASCRVAVNESASWSGCQGLLAYLSAAGHDADFAAVMISGTHRRSVEAVAEGGADAAAIDHTVWQHLVFIDPLLTKRLTVIGRTPDWPAPPFVVSGALEGAVRERLIAGLLGVRSGAVEGLERIEACDEERYRGLLASAVEQAALTRVLLARSS